MKFKQFLKESTSNTLTYVDVMAFAKKWDFENKHGTYIKKFGLIIFKFYMNYDQSVTNIKSIDFYYFLPRVLPFDQAMNINSKHKLKLADDIMADFTRFVNRDGFDDDYLINNVFHRFKDYTADWVLFINLLKNKNAIKDKTYDSDNWITVYSHQIPYLPKETKGSITIFSKDKITHIRQIPDIHIIAKEYEFEHTGVGLHTIRFTRKEVENEMNRRKAVKEVQTDTEATDLFGDIFDM